MKIFFERHIAKVIFLLGLSAVGIYVENQPELSFYIFISIVCLSLLHIIRTGKSIQGLSDTLHKESSSTSFITLIQAAQEKIILQESYFKQVAIAIGKIGDHDHAGLENLNLKGEVGDALQSLQSKLKAVKEEESIRIWAAQGIAEISEIRKNNSSLADYSYSIIKGLAKYMNANQAAFYYMSGDDKNQYLELLSAYAYERRKHTSEKITIDIGVGLVGQSVLERQMIFMTDVPKDYVKITSGLGSATPRCITILPLLFRDNVYGVVEMASFQKFEKYKLDFLTKACEGIAMELSGIRTQEQTRKLLEQSQEEELRQNLLEMQRTQVDMQRKEEELNAQLAKTQKARAMAESERRKNEAILEGCMDAVISFNENGKVEYFNKAAEEIFGFSRGEMVGNPVQDILDIHFVENTKDGSVIIRNAQGNEVNVRTEINTNDKTGEEISLLLTATKVKIDSHYLFTLFAQKVSVELF